MSVKDAKSRLASATGLAAMDLPASMRDGIVKSMSQCMQVTYRWPDGAQNVHPIQCDFLAHASLLWVFVVDWSPRATGEGNRHPGDQNDRSDDQLRDTEDRTPGEHPATGL